MFVKYTILFLTLGLSLYFDLRERKIKNFITVPAALSGCLMNFFEHGFEGLLFSLKGWIVPVAILMVFYCINVMGAGDIKLFAAIGAIMGLPFTINSLIFSIFFGAVIAVTLLLWRGQFLQKIRQLFSYFYLCFIIRKLALYSHKDDISSKFPFSPAIVPAVMLQLILTG